MNRKRLAYLALLIFCALLFHFYNKTSIRAIDENTKPLKIKIDTLNSNQPFDLDEYIDSVNYTFLELKESSKVLKADQMILVNHRIYILSKQQHCIFVFSEKGEFIFKMASTFIDNMQIRKNRLFIYNKPKGELHILSLEGNLIKKLNIGFRGMEFACLNDDQYAFYTGGIETKDKGSLNSEMSLTDTSGKFITAIFPIHESFVRLNYYSPGKLCITGDSVYVVRNFGTTLYSLNSTLPRAVYELDFRNFQLTDTAFMEINRVENYHLFQYVFDLTAVFHSKNYTFFKFSFTGQEGYLLIDSKSGMNIKTGIGTSSGSASDYNAIIPEAHFNDRLASAIAAKDFLHNLTAYGADYKKSILYNQVGDRINDVLSSNANPVIMTYTLRRRN